MTSRPCASMAVKWWVPTRSGAPEAPPICQRTFPLGVNLETFSAWSSATYTLPASSTAKSNGWRNWPFPLSETYTLPSGPTAIFPATSAGVEVSNAMNLNSPGLVPGLPHRRSTAPAGEITVTRWLRSVTYRLPSGPTASASGWFSPSDFALWRAVMVNGLGSGRDAALAFVPVAVAAFPEQPATRTARPAAAAATARRVVVFSMVPPVCRRSPWTVRRRKAGGIGAATRAGLWPARIFPAAAVPQSGHGTRGAVRGHPGTPGRAGPLGRSGARGRRAGRSRRCHRGAGRGGGAGPVHHIRRKLGRPNRADRVRRAGPDRRGPGDPPGPAAWPDRGPGAGRGVVLVRAGVGGLAGRAAADPEHRDGGRRVH